MTATPRKCASRPFRAGPQTSRRKAAEKKLEAISAEMEDIVLAHEFTHALEDQYWPIDDPKDHDLNGVH